MAVNPQTLLLADDTIYARASGIGRVALAVYRISGPAVRTVAKQLLGRLPTPRHATLRTLRMKSGETLDEGISIFFPGPASFTGEDSLELHLHGSRAVEQALSETMAVLGVRPAEPGEFTLRAVKNGKMDLLQAEGLSDLIDSETTSQRTSALGLLGGGLETRISAWRTQLLAVLSPLAADIDFPDEDDVPASVAAGAIPAMDALMASLNEAVAEGDATAPLRDGVAVVLAGAPNAGKSSLLNRLAGSDVAIVSDEPGTTRDVVEIRLDVHGQLVRLADTAGLRDDPTGKVEAEGIRRTRQRYDQADVRVLVVDATCTDWSFASGRDAPEPDIILLNKIDLYKDETRLLQRDTGGPGDLSHSDTAIPVSAKTGDGITAFLTALEAFFPVAKSGQDGPTLIRARHRDAARTAIGALAAARDLVLNHPELAAEELRRADHALRALTGGVDVEDVLGDIFSNFCIGK